MLIKPSNVLNDKAEVQRIFAIVEYINILLSTGQLKIIPNQSKTEISSDLTQQYVAQFVKAQILEDINKSNHVEVDRVSNLDLSPG